MKRACLAGLKAPIKARTEGYMFKAQAKDASERRKYLKNHFSLKMGNLWYISGEYLVFTSHIALSSAVDLRASLSALLGSSRPGLPADPFCFGDKKISHCNAGAAQRPTAIISNN